MFIMEYLYIFIICGFTVSRAYGDSYFYLTLFNGSDISVLRGESPINTGNIQWGAKSYYNSSMNQTGWDVLEVITNPDLSDDVQAYHAGWIEGFLTQKQIFYHWYNTVKSSCIDIPVTCKRVNKYLLDNRKWIQTRIDGGDSDPYWHQVKLFYRQIDGLYDGYMNATSDEEKFSYEDLISINFLSDIMSLQDSLSTGSENKLISKSGHCSVLIKFLPGYSDVLFAHNAWIDFSYMNRIIKRYNFAYHLTAKSTKLIPGRSQAFSSYAGRITSLDDFYIINSGLVVTETSIYVYHRDIYKHNSPIGQVLETVRSIVSNRLSSNTAEWARYFSVMNSGTYNNQWMIIDLKKFKPGSKPRKGFLQVVEQMPGLIESQDQTPHITANSYWASYNVPFYKNIFAYSGYEKNEKKYGFYFSYKNSPRAKILAREQKSVVDLDSMIKAIRYNHYKTDPYSVCPTCNPKPNGCMSVASRCDLNPENGTYILDLHFNLYGAIDAKVGSYSMYKKGEMISIGGPSSSGGVLPHFRWSNAQPNNMSHLGQPDLWNFEPLLTSWLHQNTQTNPDDKVETIYNYH